jgi:hypothetical protein
MRNSPAQGAKQVYAAFIHCGRSLKIYIGAGTISTGDPSMMSGPYIYHNVGAIRVREENREINKIISSIKISP